jgi:hypothetical protein
MEALFDRRSVFFRFIHLASGLVLWLRYASQPKNWKVFVHDGRSARAATMKSL